MSLRVPSAPRSHPARPWPGAFSESKSPQGPYGSSALAVLANYCRRGDSDTADAGQNPNTGLPDTVLLVAEWLGSMAAWGGLEKFGLLTKMGQCVQKGLGAATTERLVGTDDIHRLLAYLIHGLCISPAREVLLPSPFYR